MTPADMIIAALSDGGRTVEQVSRVTSIPLGVVARALRELVAAGRASVTNYGLYSLTSAPAATKPPIRATKAADRETIAPVRATKAAPHETEAPPLCLEPGVVCLADGPICLTAAAPPAREEVMPRGVYERKPKGPNLVPGKSDASRKSKTPELVLPEQQRIVCRIDGDRVVILYGESSEVRLTDTQMAQVVGWLNTVHA